MEEIIIIVEVGIKLSKDLNYYDKILKKNGLNNSFNVETHDIYYTNKKLDNLTENEMKNSCIRLRSCNNKIYKIQNNLLEDLNVDELSADEVNEFENRLSKLGYKKIFDTYKKDHHYSKYGMNSKVQLQEIEEVGLLVYYDNSLYYDMPMKEQRRKLIDELKLFGFDEIDYNTLGLDKLRTLYYKKECYSLNQNN